MHNMEHYKSKTEYFMASLLKLSHHRDKAFSCPYIAIYVAPGKLFVIMFLSLWRFLGLGIHLSQSLVIIHACCNY